MCGIFTLIGDGLPDKENWSTTDLESYIARHRDLFPLSSSDVAKLANLDQLHSLDGQRTKINANLKLSADEKQFEMEKIDLQVDQLVGVELPPSFSSCDLPLGADDLRDVVDAVAARGPDYLGYQVVSSRIHCCSSVLSLKAPFTPQPYIHDSFVVQYNGELYGNEGNDTEYISKLVEEKLATMQRREAILSAFNTIKGEFALVIIDKVEQKIYFGRDRVGKRSLVIRKSPHQTVISSVGLGPGSGFEEVDNRIWVLDDDTIEKIAYTKVSPSPSTFVECLFKAVTERFKIDPFHPHEVLAAVLFSGGLDCTILAHLLASQPNNVPIDLITVGFDHPRTKKSASSCPDRLLAKSSWFNLCRIHGSRLRLVEINVSYQQWLQGRRHVQSLMAPTATEMDLSIAMAFYFASAKDIPGISLLQFTTVPETYDESYITTTPNYSSSAPVLFSGLGADELFAGYSRHEALFSRLEENDDATEAYSKLVAMLAYDVNMIHSRNLGRDDRVIGVWGKEVRYPYLDDDVIARAEALSPQEKIGIDWQWQESKRRGRHRVKVVERKRFLRQVARTMGLSFVADAPKRAIQFGAKSAKLEIGQGKSKGTDHVDGTTI